MNDDQILSIYQTGCGRNVAQGLRDVYDAGRNHDVWAAGERARLNDQTVAQAQAKLDEKNNAERARVDALARLTPEQQRLSEEQRLADEARKKEADALAEERRLAAEKVAAEKNTAQVEADAQEAERTRSRLAALEQGFVREPFDAIPEAVDAPSLAARNSGRVDEQSIPRRPA